MSGSVRVCPPHGHGVEWLVDLEHSGHPQNRDQNHRDDAGDGKQKRDDHNPSGIWQFLGLSLKKKF